jgi:HAD superfamily hydrolase (TIGR01549 family)
VSVSPLTAIIWDFDNTLVDSRHKNLSVTRDIVERVTGRPAGQFEALVSVAAYDLAHHRVHNWQSFYKDELGLSSGRIRQAGDLWTEYQLRDRTPSPVFGGIAEVLEALADLPHGIVSQNSRDMILRELEQAGLGEAFENIIGYEEVSYHTQKPAPDGLLACLKALTDLRPGSVLYVGDHQTDLECARNANRVLSQDARDVSVLSVLAAYGTVADGSDAPWTREAGYRADRPTDILDIVNLVTDGTDA